MIPSLGKLTVTEGRRLVQPSITLTTDLLTRPKGFQIGRNNDNDLVLPDQHVSGQHLRILLTGDRVMLIHLSQNNPTLLDGTQLPLGQPVPMPERAILIIEPYTLEYVATLAVTVVAARQVATQSPDPTVGGTIVLAPPLGEPPPPFSFPWPIPDDRPGRYLDDMPAIYQASWPRLPRPNDDPKQIERRRFLGNYLKIFEAIWEPMEQRQDHLEQYLNPRTCPEAMLPLLARWLGMAVPEALSVIHQRDLLAAAPQIYALRGTMAGLQLAIKAATGLNAVISEEPGVSYTIRIALPASPVAPEVLRSLIRRHKPAHAGYILELS